MRVSSCVYKNYSICVFAVDLYAYERTFVDLQLVDFLISVIRKNYGTKK